MILSHVGSVFSTSCILGRAPRTKETRSARFFVKSWVWERGHDWGHLISKQGTNGNHLSYYLFIFYFIFNRSIMSVSSIPVICYYNGDILRTEKDVKYVRNKALNVPLDIPANCTFEQLGDIIFSSTTIDKQKFKSVLKCKYPLKSGNRFQPFPIWNDSTVHRMLNMVNTTAIEEIELFVEVVRINQQVNQSMGVAENENVAEIDYGRGPSSGPVLDTEVYGDDDACAYEEGNDESDEDVDDEYDEELHVQANGHVSSFQTTNQVLENEQGIFVSVHSLSCDVSNTADDEGPDESAPIHFHLPPPPYFEHAENIDIAISSGWTPWGQETTSYLSGEFVVGQAF